VLRHNPDIFLYPGDNIYGDTKDMKILRSRYAQLAAKPEFQRLKKGTKYWLPGTTTILAEMMQVAITRLKAALPLPGIFQRLMKTAWKAR